MHHDGASSYFRVGMKVALIDVTLDFSLAAAKYFITKATATKATATMLMSQRVFEASLG